MASEKSYITTPNGATVEVTVNGTTLRCKLTWADDFAPKCNRAFSAAQAMFDHECARLMDPYVPFDTGTLKTSVVLASSFGSGQLVYDTPYARAQYYLHPQGSSIHDGKRGSYWGQRMAADHRTHLRNFAAGALRKGMNG